MDTKNLSVSEASNIEKTAPIQLETVSVSSATREEVRRVTNLTAKEQYSRLWTAIKADKRFVWWALYVMVLVFGKWVGVYSFQQTSGYPLTHPKVGAMMQVSQE